MTGRVRYGDLLRDASNHLLRGTVILTRDRFDDTAAADAAIAAHQDLLHGLGRLGGQLFGADPGVRGLRMSAERDPRWAASGRLVEELDAVGHARSRWCVAGWGGRGVGCGSHRGRGSVRPAGNPPGPRRRVAEPARRAAG